jgi:NAD(P)-dependent dehydrogenase (short-subunit alcohol dehydrogenase family)
VDSCRAAVADVLADYKRLDVLVNNAGINARGATEEMPESIWQPVIDVNVGGTLRMCQAAFPALRDADRGAIVNLSSSAALVAIGGAAAYGISKAAISHLTKILALEWARHGIRVNAVAPTIVRSAMTADVLDDASYMREKLASIPLGRIATASDVARAVAWLAGPDSSMTTGISLPVDGGASLG